ncbi:MAG: hypothetical protein ABJP02_10505 [Parasphingorhabdus sp.]|uniref:hypothetical protein n=1 Tax=Parasphingorhabdus sp. TaxID=2709688 RepID=UPI003297A87E
MTLANGLRYHSKRLSILTLLIGRNEMNIGKGRCDCLSAVISVARYRDGGYFRFAGPEPLPDID